MTRIGLIARCDQRGIATQTHEFYRHMKPDKTMVVLMGDPRWPEDVGMYQGVDVMYAQSDFQTRLLRERDLLAFIEGLDVIFAVETVYDWRLIDLAHALGIRVILQANAEFTVHFSQPHLPHPDVWAWPTPWLQGDERLPAGPIIPVPTVERPPTAAPPDDRVLRVLHVAGTAAAGDRNGTIEFIEAIPSIREKVHVTIVGQDGMFPRQIRHGHNVTVDAIPAGVDDRWDMYRNQHVLVSPRKYGGLSLPVLEAMATGMCVVMPNCSPNEIWPGPRITARRGRQHRSPLGPFPTWTVHPMDVAQQIDQLARNREVLHDEMEVASDWAAQNSWSELKPRIYDPLMEGN